MTLRRVVVGLTVVFGLSVWSWSRADDGSGRTQTANPTYAAHSAGEAGGGNRDDAACRFRTGQARHWRQLMIGGR